MELASKNVKTRGTERPEGDFMNDCVREVCDAWWFAARLSCNQGTTPAPLRNEPRYRNEKSWTG